MTHTQLVKSTGGSAEFEIRDSAEHIQKYWMAGKFYEAGMLDWIRRHHRGGTFIDAGACIGNHTVYFAKCCNAERVVAIEPVPELMDHLQANLARNEIQRRVLPVMEALSDEPGWGTMEDLSPAGHLNAGMHRLNVDEPIFKNGVKVTTLDGLVERLDLRDVQLVKIDCEHLEVEVLRGAAKLLKEQRPALYVELTEANYDDAVALLKLFGYTLATQHNASPTYGFVVPRGWKPLRVFNVSEYDFAACGYYLAQAFNDHTSHQARASRFKPMRIAFPSDITAPDDDFFRDMWNGSDVIHFHDGPPKLPGGLNPKPAVITHHGSHYRAASDKCNAIARKNGWVLTAATLDLVAKGAQWMPDCRPDFSRYRDKSDEFLVVHSPAHNRAGKGSQRVKDACDELGVKLDQISGLPHQTVLERKGRAHLVVDQFELGPGCNAIEAWSMGIPVIVGASDEHQKWFLERAGMVPFATPTPSLADAISLFMDTPAAAETFGYAGRHYWKRFHAPLATASRALAFYEKALMRDARVIIREGPDQPKMPPKGQRRPEGMRILRYMGANKGDHSYFPQNGTGIRYLFSAQRPNRFVYEPDVAWFLAQRDKRDLAMFEEVK